MPMQLSQAWLLNPFQCPLHRRSRLLTLKPARPAASELAQLLESKHCKHLLASAEQSWDFKKSNVHIGPSCTAEPAGKISLLLTQLKLQGRGRAKSTYPAHVKARQDSRGGCVRPMSAHIISAVSASGKSHNERSVLCGPASMCCGQDSNVSMGQVPQRGRIQTGVLRALLLHYTANVLDQFCYSRRQKLSLRAGSLHAIDV